MQLYFSKFDYNLALIRLFLLINRNTRSINYKVNLQLMISNISNALEKGIIPEKMPHYDRDKQ